MVHQHTALRQEDEKYGEAVNQKKKNQKTQEDSNPAQNKTKKELYKRQKITAQVYVL